MLIVFLAMVFTIIVLTIAGYIADNYVSSDNERDVF